MLIIGIVLSFVGLVYLCWLIFALAVDALPFFAGVIAGIAAYHSGSGPIAAIAVGAIAGVIVLFAGRIALRNLRSPLARTAIALLFVLPAAVAGYHATNGLAHIVVPSEGWREAIAVIGAVVIAAIAWMRITLSAPLDVRGGIAAGVTSRSRSQRRHRAEPGVVLLVGAGGSSREPDRRDVIRALSSERFEASNPSSAWRDTNLEGGRGVGPFRQRKPSRPFLRTSFFSFAGWARPLVQVAHYHAMCSPLVASTRRATRPLMA